MKNNNPENRKKFLSSDGILLGVFLIIFAVCIIPFASGMSDSSKNNSKKNTEDDIPAAEQKEYTVPASSPVSFITENNIDCIKPEDFASEAVLLYDYSENKILFSKNSSQPLYPASTTKIMTAYTAVKYLPSDYILKVGSELSLLAYDSSIAGLKENDEISLNDILYALLLPSGNDAAYTIAVNTARYLSNKPLSDSDAVHYFCELMNEEAELIGAENTHFCDPDGYHNQFHYTTAEDLLRISLMAYECELIRNIVAVPSFDTVLKNGKAYHWDNGNCLVVNDNQYYLPFATGFKTGFMDEAGYTMVASAVSPINGHKLFAVTLKSPTLKGRYTDAANLFYSVIDTSKIIREPIEPAVSPEPVV